MLAAEKAAKVHDEEEEVLAPEACQFSLHDAGSQNPCKGFILSPKDQGERSRLKDSVM